MATEESEGKPTKHEVNERVMAAMRFEGVRSDQEAGQRLSQICSVGCGVAGGRGGGGGVLVFGWLVGWGGGGGELGGAAAAGTNKFKTRRVRSFGA